MYLPCISRAQENEFASGTKFKILGHTETLLLTDSNGVDLRETKVVAQKTKYDVGKEMAGVGAIAGALVGPIISSVSTGVKRYSENRALSFEGAHEASATWIETPIRSNAPNNVVTCEDKYFECPDGETTRVVLDETVKYFDHHIPYATYKRTVMRKDNKDTYDALIFSLKPEAIAEGRYYYALKSYTSSSSPTRMKRKAPLNTIRIRPTIHYYDGDEKKSMELGTLTIPLVETGIANEPKVSGVNTDQFLFKDTYRFAGMSIAVTETNPNKKKAEKRKEAIAAYNTDENKEAITNVINLLIPSADDASEGGSGDGGADTDKE